MLTLLHGAKRNVGDFLIFERAKELIRTYRKAESFLILPRWQPLTEHLDAINRCEAVIWCGGPGYARDFYPRVIPLVNNLADIEVPIVPMGLGWGVGESSDGVDDFRFSAPAQEALERIHARIPYSSVRDVLTERVVRNAGIRNVVTTGCAAWYHLPTVTQDFVPPQAVRRIVVTTPAQHRFFREAAQVTQLIGRTFPEAERYLVFHRGILPGKHTRMRAAVDNMWLAQAGYRAGFKIVDASYSTERIAFYEECDLHIGYRVHAHIDFLSLRLPSILLQEDARGEGQSMTLGTADIRAGGEAVVETLEQRITEHLDTRFEAFKLPTSVMQTKHEVMRDFVQSF